MTTTALKPRSAPEAIERHEELLDELFEDVFRPKPRLKVSEWAARHRIISPDAGAAMPGPWRNEMTPYLVDIMDALSDPEVTDMVIMKSVRVGFTEGVIGNGVGYFVDQEPSPIIVVQPTETDAKDWSKTQLQPMLRDMPTLGRRFSSSGSRDPENTLLDKRFTGGYLKIRGAHSPKAARRITGRVIFIDERSAMLPTADGDAVKLFESRADTFPNRKIVRGSTPTDVKRCRITPEFQRSDQRYWNVPCPHCGHEQTLRWGGPEATHGIKWDRVVRCAGCRIELENDEAACPDCGGTDREVIHDPDSAYYLCEKNGCVIHEHEKTAMVRAGRWVPTKSESRIPGWHINALISLISAKAAWPSLVREWLSAQGNPEELQVFVNNVLGEPWEEKGQKVDLTKIKDRGEIWPGRDGKRVEVPEGVGVLLASVDVQKAWLEVLVRGWGAGEESWGVFHQRIHRHTDTPEAWAELDAIRLKAFRHAAGGTMRITAMAVDVGYGVAVYPWVKAREAQSVYAVKGRAGDRPPISRGSKANKDGVITYTLGVDGLKDRLFRRLQIQPAAVGDRVVPGLMHFAAPWQEKFNGFDGEYFDQFGREKKVRKRHRNGTISYEYVATGRNEAVDLEVYNLGAFYMLSAAIRDQLGMIASNITSRGEGHQDPGPGRRIVRRRRGRVHGAS